MDQQAITELMVETVLTNPRWTPATTRGTRYDGVAGGRRLCVVLAEEHATPRVITVFWYDEDRNR